MYTTLDLIEDLKVDFSRYLVSVEGSIAVSFCRKLKTFLRSPTFWVIAVHRYGFWLNHRAKRKYYPSYLLLKCAYHVGRIGCALVTKTMISESTEIGKGLFLSPKGGIILGAKRMGMNCTVYEQATIGMGKEQESPVIGNRVWIGSNSIVYGKIRLGDGVSIMEGGVLSKSVPDGCVIKGNPGRIILKEFDNTALRSGNNAGLERDKGKLVSFSQPRPNAGGHKRGDGVNV